MAFTAANLHLRPGAAGDLVWTYDAGSDTQSTVLAVGYFNNSDDDQNFTAEDMIWVQATDGNMWLRVSSISAGTVTTQFAGGNLPVQTPGTGTAVAKASDLLVGMYEIGSSISTATRYVLPTPYPGAEVLVTRASGSGGGAIWFDAGGSGATSIVYDNKGSRRIRLARTGEFFHVRGVSTTRWRIVGMSYNATGASASAGGGASEFLVGT